jgi:myo-inositol-1(or 4)-monophosphatase
MEPSSLLPVARRAAALGVRIITERDPGALTAKGDRDMASEVDFAVERAVRAFLAEHTPEIGFLGEEEGARDPGTELTWVLDPVDGTANFVHNIPLCGLSLGLARGDETVLGVIELPFLGLGYAGVRGGGATGNGRTLSVRAGDRLEGAIVAVGDYAVGAGSELNPARLEITRLLAQRVQRVRMLGSAAVDLAWVGEGRLDACISLSNKPWDTAAGTLIAREAGADVIDLDGSPHTLRSSATIATAPGLRTQLLELIQLALGRAGAMVAETDMSAL